MLNQDKFFSSTTHKQKQNQNILVSSPLYSSGHSIANPLGNVNELLQTTNEWTNIQHIIKITFKEVYEILKNMSTDIRNIEAQLNTKAPILETNSTIISNHQELMQNMNEIIKVVKLKPGYDELEDKVSKEELNNLLANKVSHEQLSASMLNYKSEITFENKIMHERMIENFSNFKL